MAPVTTELKVLVKAIGKGEIKELEASLQKLAVTARTKVDVNFKQVGAELKKIQNTSVQSIQNLRDYRNAWRDIAKQLDVSSKEFKDARAEAERLDKQLAKIEGRRTGGAGGRLRAGAQIAGTIAGAGVFGGIEGALGAGFGALFGGPAGAIVGGGIGAQLGGFRQAAGAVAEYSAQLAKLRIALQGVTSNQTEYQLALQAINQATEDFAIPQSLVTQQFTRLQASVQGAGGNIRDTETAFKGIVAAVRATGGSLADVDGALTATAQVFSKGKVSAEELRQQIGERLPGAFTIFAESIGKTPQELDKALEQGQVSLQDFQVFAEELFRRYGETAQEIADGPASAGDRLKVALENLQEAIGPTLAEIGRKFQEFATFVIEKLTPVANLINRLTGQDLAGKTARLAALEQKILPRAEVQARRFLVSEGTSMQLALEYQDYLQGLRNERDRLSKELNQRQIQEQESIPESRLPGIVPGTKDKSGAGAAQKIKEISQAEYELRKQILQAKIDGREIDVIGFETQLKMLSIQESNLGAMAKEVAIMEVLRAADEKLLKLEEQRSQQSLESYFNAQKAIEEENALYEQQKFKILETSIAVGAISEEEGKRLEKQMKIKDIAAEYKVDLEAATKIYERQNQTIKQQESIWKSIGEAIQSGVGSAIENLIFEAQSLQESLSGILRSVASLLIQYGTKTLFSSFGFANGGIMTGRGPLELKSYARGGVARSPQLAMFGEGSLPEAYVPLPDGRSIPVTMRGGGGAGNIVVNVDAKGTQVEGDNNRSRQLGGAISAAVQAELIKQQRPGGLLNR